MSMNHVIRCCLVLVLLFGALYRPEESFADQASPRLHALTQPDGTTFSARPWGDEWMSGWDTTDQYAIIQNQQGYWTYAARDMSGRFTPTAFVVGREDPAVYGISKRLRPFFRPVNSPAKIQIVLLINFSDTMPVMTPNSFYTKWFGPEAPDPVTEWIHRGRDDAKHFPERPVNVTDWYTAAHPHVYYGKDVTDNQGNRIRDAYSATLVIEAVKAADETVDFTEYDRNGDCYVDLVMVVHQGTAQEETKKSDELWSLQGTLNEAKTNRDGTGEVTTNDSCYSGMLMKVNVYAIQPEIRTLLRH